LADYSVTEIERALLLYSGEFFPSVDDITALMNRQRELRAEQKAMQTEDQAAQDRRAIAKFMREHDGKTPQQVFVEENQELIRKIDMDLIQKQPGDAARSPRNLKAKNQSRVLGCESGNR
jgi:hypothetical protein